MQVEKGGNVSFAWVDDGILMGVQGAKPLKKYCFLAPGGQINSYK